MARPIRITTKGLRELQAAMKQMESACDVEDLKPVLADALMPIKEEALRNLKRQVVTGGPLRLPGQQHIEDALVVQKGKGTRIATAFCKVFHKFAPQGIWIEFGHILWRGGIRKSGGGHQIGEVKERPFFRPAVDAKRAETRKTINKGIKSLLMRKASLLGFKERPGFEPEDTGWMG